MRVALDTNALYVTQAGIARYVRGLLGALQKAPAPGIEIHPVAWPVENFGYQQPARAWRTFYREIIWTQHLAPRELKRLRADLAHSTMGPFMRIPANIPEVVTLHDLAVLRNPQRYRSWQRFVAPRRLKRLAQARRIICISRFTADEAMQLLGLKAGQLTVVHNGCDFTDAVPKEQAPGAACPSEFFLFVGSLEPGKNLALLREVYALAAQRGVSLPPLLIVGARWEGVAGEGSPPAGWHYLGRQPDEALVYLYRRALALIFPSRYEGFGLPVLEAMALSCPVVCSPVASLPEVAGDAALLTPQAAPDYLAALRRISEEASLRGELIAKGRERAKQFSWDKCAAQTLEVYRSV